MNPKKSVWVESILFQLKSMPPVLWCPIKMRAFHQNESCLACPDSPSSYEGGRKQVGSFHFDKKPLILIGHYGKYIEHDPATQQHNPFKRQASFAECPMNKLTSYFGKSTGSNK